MKIFLDTNVVLDVFLPSRPDKQNAQEVLNLISMKKIEGYVASFSIATITYFLQKAFKENTIPVIKLLLAQLHIVELDKKDFTKALSLGFKDLEDAYQAVAAGKVPGLNYLLTQNIKDFRLANLDCIRPEQLLRSLV